MVMTEHTYLREIRKSLNLDITVAMLVTCMQEGHHSLSIIKFDKRGCFGIGLHKTAAMTGICEFTSGFWVHLLHWGQKFQLYNHEH
jgi:hypothetical protein